MKEHEEISFGLLFIILTDHANAAKVCLHPLIYQNLNLTLYTT